MIAKNVASQGVYLYAHDTSSDAPKTGDAANITGTISKDGGAAAALGTTNPTEIGDGVYWQPLSQAETNADALAIAWESSTGDIQIEPLICLTDRGAVALQATASALATTDGKVDTIDGIVDTMTAKLVGTIAAGTHNPQSGDAYARLGAPAGASVAADIAAIDAGTAPTADEIADAVWDEPVSEHGDAGSAGAALSVAQSAGDPWSTEIPGAYADGTAGQILGDNVEAIRNKTDTIGAAAVTVTSPVLASGDATIYAGQAHVGANALTWAISDWSGPSLAGNTAKLRIQPQARYDRSAASRAATAEYAATVTQAGTDVAVSVSLTDAQTSAITPGTYHGQVVATVSGEDTIVVDFTLTVGKALDAPAA